jgi:1-acyl-sn-glycerol-3-phosphate acyltransferase
MRQNHSAIHYYLACQGVRCLCCLLGGIEVFGRENFPESSRLIVVSNHLSHLDPPLVGGVVPWYTHCMAKEELFQTPFIGWWCRCVGAFPVKRGAADRQALRTALQVLEMGRPLVLFPEGRRSKDGRLQPGEEGVGLIALRSRAPIIAIGIAGSQSILPPGSFRFRRGHVTIRIGKPFTLDDLYGQTGRPAVIEATRRVMTEIASLLPPEYQPADGVPRAISVA